MKVKINTVCDTYLETNNELLRNVSMGSNVNVFHVASSTHNQSETMDSRFENSKTVDSGSMYIETIRSRVASLGSGG